MELHSFSDPVEFINLTRASLELNEVANSLILGIGMRLTWFPKTQQNLPYLATVTDSSGLVLAALLTPPQNLVLSYIQGDLTQACQLVVNNLISQNQPIPGTIANIPVANAFTDAWIDSTGKQVSDKNRLTLYEINAVQPLPVMPGHLRLAAQSDLDMISGWSYAFNKEIFGSADQAQVRRSAELRIADNDVYLWEDDIPCSLVIKTRPTSHGISIGQVYTPPQFRSKGYATACVSELCRELLQSGYTTCALFADISNQTANHIYREIGFQPNSEFEVITYI